MDEQQRRQELMDFLRTRRERCSPAEVGLPNSSRRRTPGLRREEVAQLANVSTTWYTWLEQGRDIGVSVQVLEGIVQALKLSPEERNHLFLLALQQTPPDLPTQPDVINPSLQRIVERWDVIGPAYITNLRWDVLVWNQSACVLLDDFAAMSSRERNFIWFYFTNPAHRQMTVDWKDHAQLIVSKFRGDCSHYLGDRQLTEFVEDLKRVSLEFREWWSRHDVYSRTEGRKEYNHPQVGKLVFEYTVFQPEGASNLRCVLYTPLPDSDTSQKFQQLKKLSNAGQP